MLEMHDVTKNFGTFRALDALSMKVPKGAVYGLVGPNGAGKSTALRILTGVYRQDSGTVCMEGQPVYENPAVKQRMCAIGDDVFYFPSATLEDMGKFYRGIYPAFDAALFRRLSEAFQLPARTPLRRLSKGMQKQAAFQLSLSVRPEVLVLDEPVDGLDPVMRRQVWSLILSDVAQQGTTVLVSSHNLRELEDICDHVGILHKGKMLLEQSLAQLQGGTVKLQLVGTLPAGLEVLHESTAGRLRTLIVRGSGKQVTEALQAAPPDYFDILPLSLEELFIYELGGVHHEVRDILI